MYKFDNFDNIASITSLKELNNPRISENKDYIILFFYWNMCGACHAAIPIVCDIFKSLPKNYNSKIIKVHNTDINDIFLKEIYTGGVPAFRILKRTEDNYELCTLKNKNYNYCIDGFAENNFINEGKKYLSTKNTLIEWIIFLNNRKNNIQIIYEEKKPEIKNEDDGSEYNVLNSNLSKLKKSKSFNKIINEQTNFNKYLF